MMSFVLVNEDARFEESTLKDRHKAVSFAASVFACALSGLIAGSAPAFAAPVQWPTSDQIARAASDESDWLSAGKSLEWNRYTTLKQIDAKNVTQLKPAWTYKIDDDGEQEAAPIVWHGTMFISTPHDHVIALDAKTGVKKWEFSYTPSHMISIITNRGVALVDGKVVLGTLDGRVVALDANTGKQLWNVAGVEDPANTWYASAPSVYGDTVIIGTSGGDQGNVGQVSAFRISDGKRVWVWHNVPRPGEAGHETWPGDSWQHGCADAWAGVSIDVKTGTLFEAPGNPCPDLVDTQRAGANLYSDSVVALDIAHGAPKLKWYYQLIPDDTHDADPAMPPILFTGVVNGHPRDLVAQADKAGDFVILDRATGALVHRSALVTQRGLDGKPTVAGQTACPNHGGGVEWNGGAYDPASNLFLIPATDECATWKIDEGPVPYTPGQRYQGGAFPRRGGGHGVINAIDVATGTVAWRKDVPFPAQGGMLVTASGLAFTSEVDGVFYALDAKTGTTLWQYATGSAIVDAPSAYQVGGTEYVAVVSGQPGSQNTREMPKQNAGSFITAFAVDTK
jgi:alcohol dehydrogenase (cytochrome c)